MKRVKTPQKISIFSSIVIGVIAGVLSGFPEKVNVNEWLALGIGFVFAIPLWSFLVGKVDQLLKPEKPRSGIWFLLIGLFFGGVGIGQSLSVLIWIEHAEKISKTLIIIPFSGVCCGFVLSWWFKYWNPRNGVAK